MDNSEIVNPVLDISLRTLPLDMTDVFGNPNECLLEIGFGDGDFLAAIPGSGAAEGAIGDGAFPGAIGIERRVPKREGAKLRLPAGVGGE